MVARRFQVVQPNQLLGSVPPPSFMGLQQGFLGDALGHGFGSLFGDASGLVDFGGGNFFQPGQGFFNQIPGPVQPGAAIPAAPGFDFGGFLGSIFGR